MTTPTSPDGQWRSLTQWIDETAGHGALRADALVAMLRPFGCTVRAQRGPTGLRSVHIYGATPVVDYLRDQLDAWLTALEAAAKAAARRYRAWLRTQDEPDHMPAERRNLSRAYRRQYLPAWANAWAARLSDVVTGRDSDPGDPPAVGHNGAHAAARHDVALLDPQPLKHAAGVIRANDPCRRYPQAAPAPHSPPIGSVRPDGPGRIAPGQRVTCLPGSLPARDGSRGGGVLLCFGAKTSLVDVYGGRQRRIPNELLHPEAGPWIAADREARGLRTATATGRGWLPGWSWLDWTIAQHLEYLHGQRQLPSPPPAPQRLIIVACGARKKACVEARAGQMYVGSYHQAARRAANALTIPGTRVMILSARYGLLDTDDVIMRYEMRLGQRYAITAQGLREQAEQLGVADTAEVVVLAPAAYADLAAQVWPHAQRPLAGTRGIGEQIARLAALATGRATVPDLVSPQPAAVAPQTTLAADEHAVSVRGGLVHLAHTPPGRAGTLTPVCPADQPDRSWRLTNAAITCTRCAATVAGRRALNRWCALVDRTAPADDTVAANMRTDKAASLTGPHRPRPNRPGPHHQPPSSRSTPSRRPGGTPHRRTRDGWRLVPAVATRDVPLVSTIATSRDQPSRRRYPRHGRQPIGRAPPRPRRGPHPRLTPGRRRSPRPCPDTVPSTHNPLTRQDTNIDNGSANGTRRAST